MSKRKKNRGVWIALLVLVGGGGAGLAWARSNGYVGGAESVQVRGEAVRRGPLSITVTESGNLESAKSTALANELEGRTTILYLIEEGTYVQPGELLCELDTSNLVDQRVQQEIRVQNAEAAWVKAKQSFEIQKSQNESTIALAERELEFAQEDLKKYEDGDWPQQKQAAEEAILLANEELTRARQDLEWSEKLAQKGFLEQSQLDADRLASTRAEIKLNQAKRDLELLIAYEYPRSKKELEADVVEKGRELDRARLEADARIVDFEADLRSSKATLDLERSELDQMLKQLDKARIYAPVAGMVVYHKERSRWGNSEPIREGTEVRERQELIQIPSSDRMIAEVSLHESVLEKVEPGLPCRIRVDAIPGEVFGGVVKFKSVLPDQNSFWANPDLRVYRTDIEVTDRHPAMRPGMSCSVEILVEDFDDALYAPVQSVFLDAGEPVAFVATGDGYERREVQVGANDGKVVVVEEGLAEGEVVALSTPPGVTLRPASDGRSDGLPWERPAATTDTPADGGGEAAPGADPAAAAQGMDREAMRRAMENMSDEDRARMREAFGRMREGGGGNGQGTGGGRPGGDGMRGGGGDGERSGEGRRGGRGGEGGGRPGGDE